MGLNGRHQHECSLRLSFTASCCHWHIFHIYPMVSRSIPRTIPLRLSTTCSNKRSGSAASVTKHRRLVVLSTLLLLVAPTPTGTQLMLWHGVPPFLRE